MNQDWKIISQDENQNDYVELGSKDDQIRTALLFKGDRFGEVKRVLELPSFDPPFDIFDGRITGALRIGSDTYCHAYAFRACRFVLEEKRHHWWVILVIVDFPPDEDDPSKFELVKVTQTGPFLEVRSINSENGGLYAGVQSVSEYGKYRIAKLNV